MSVKLYTVSALYQSCRVYTIIEGEFSGKRTTFFSNMCVTHNKLLAESVLVRSVSPDKMKVHEHILGVSSQEGW